MSINLKALKPSTRLMPPTILIYGPGGVGKTKFGSDAPKPIFLFTEDGQGMLNAAAYPLAGEGNPVATSYDQVLGAVGELYTQEHDFQTLVLDSLDHLEPLIWKKTCEVHRQPVIDSNEKGAEFSFQRGYAAALEQAKLLFSGLDALRRDRGMAIILIVHADVKRYDPPDSTGYDRYQLKLHKLLASFVFEWADNVLFANYKSAVVSDVGKFNKERKRGVGRGDRILYTEERPPFLAKNRYSLPPEIELSWEAFQSSIGTALAASVTQETDNNENKENDNG